MKHLQTFESNEERADMIAQLCEMGYDQATCDTMSYEELCDCMQRELSKEDSEYEGEEYVGENAFKKVGEFLGIKGMSPRIDKVLGLQGETIQPTKEFKAYLRQAKENDYIPNFDMSVIEKSLRKAREVGYGIKMFKDEPDLSKMQGSEEEKKIAKYFIKRAIHSIQTTSGGGHEFGHKPDITGLDDNTSYSKLKHLKTFESFKNK